MFHYGNMVHNYYHIDSHYYCIIKLSIIIINMENPVIKVACQLILTLINNNFLSKITL